MRARLEAMDPDWPRSWSVNGTMLELGWNKTAERVGEKGRESSGDV